MNGWDHRILKSFHSAFQIQILNLLYRHLYDKNNFATCYIDTCFHFEGTVFMVTAFLDFAFRPFSGKEEDTLRSKRPSLLSEVIFLQPAAVTRNEKSAAKSTDGDR